VKAGRTIRKRKREEGIALLIAIFILLLIGVVGIALVISSGTESALAVNYRSSTGVYYAAVAGLEEVRARLRPSAPNYFGATDPGVIPTPLGTCGPVYVLNPLGGEAVTPWDPANPYYDNQFGQEFGAICGGAGALPPSPSPFARSIWNRAPLNGLPIPGPSYKWVRINGVTERSLNMDTCNYDTSLDATLVYYGVAPAPPLAPCNPNPPNLSLNDAGVGSQVLELTALAVLPNGSRKLVQYLVARAPLTLPPFLAALTISGNNGGGGPTFHAPANNAVYAIKGNDYDCNGNPTASPPSIAIGLFGPYTGTSYSADISSTKNGIPSSVGGPPPADPQLSYTGTGAAPDVEYLNTYPTNMESPTQLDAIVTQITQNADVTLPSGSTGAALTPLNMSPTNPLTIVVEGNLDISNWSHDGYGLLLVTGTFTYDPDTTWNGIILVIGQGIVVGSHMQYKQINGAMMVAKTRDAGGNLLAGLGGGFVSFDDNMQGNGIRYSNCWIQRSMPTSGYKILSFHEIPQ